MRLIAGPELTSVLPLDEVIEEIRRALSTPSEVPQRLALTQGACQWLVMPGLTGHGDLVCKIVRVGPLGETAPRSGATLSGAVFVLTAAGQLRAIFDGAELTQRRTAAVTAYATDWLARPDAQTLALFGVGALALPHLEALSMVRRLVEVRVVARSFYRAKRFADELGNGKWRVRAYGDPAEAVAGADIITTVTTSSQPVFPDEAVAPGTHINAVGSFLPERAEIPIATVKRAKVVVESRATAWLEAGDLIQARAAGEISDGHVVAELHERELGHAVRQATDEITLFKSVGSAVFDLAAVDVALRRLSSAEPTTQAR
jgi:alanine dehydrogenase